MIITVRAWVTLLRLVEFIDANLPAVNSAEMAISLRNMPGAWWTDIASLAGVRKPSNETIAEVIEPWACAKAIEQGLRAIAEWEPPEATHNWLKNLLFSLEAQIRRDWGLNADCNITANMYPGFPFSFPPVPSKPPSTLPAPAPDTDEAIEAEPDTQPAPMVPMPVIPVTAPARPVPHYHDVPQRVEQPRRCYRCYEQVTSLRPCKYGHDQPPRIP